MTDIVEEDEDEDFEQQVRAVFRVVVEWVGEHLPEKPRTLPDMLSTFKLESEHKKEQAIAYWNTSDVRVAVNDAAREAQQSVQEVKRALDDVPVLRTVVEVFDQTLGQVVEKTVEVKVPPGAIHLSASAHLFPTWHLTAIPEGKPTPYAQPITNPKIIESVQHARALIEPVPRGEKGTLKPQPAGTLAWTKYAPKRTQGWMFAEPKGSEYGQWVYERMRGTYNERMEAWKAAKEDRSCEPKKRMELRAAAWRAAAVIAVMKQEGAPSSINTYDGLLLTWGIGIAGPGRLPATFAEIVQDPNVAKALYLCGFKYCGTNRFGGYQFVNTRTDPPQVEFYSPYQTTDVPDKNNVQKIQFRKGEPNYNVWHALQTFTDQGELIDLLIMLARDPLTRETILKPNYRLVEGMVNVAGSEHITNEALFVFCAEVMHNWAFGDPMIQWAIEHFTKEEAALPLGVERDRAIAKGVFRYVNMRLQRASWERAVKVLEKRVQEAQKKGVKKIEPVLLEDVHNELVYGFDRLFENYWAPLQTGVNTQDHSTLKVPDFPPVVTGPSPAGRFVVQNGKGTARYDLGDLAQCGALFETNNVVLRDFDDQGNVLITNRGVEGKMPRPVKKRVGVQVPYA